MSTAEEFKPIPVKPSTGISFRMRCLVDFQLATIATAIRPALAAMKGSVLDVGCGEMPFRQFLPAETNYTGIDVPHADGFGMGTHAEIVPFDGRTIPFPDRSFDNVICTEVLEHAEDPAALIAEIHRVLRVGGVAVVTVPFSARLHHVPHDYHRFTSFQLARLFSAFSSVEITPRGTDLTSIANKLIVLNMRLAKLRSLPLFLSVIPFSATFALLGNLSLRFGFGSQLDPLGYSVVLSK